MTKKEISELKKLFKKDDDRITRICGCYVGNEKEKITTFQEAFYSLEEEEVYKYYEIFKKTLSGTLGKNLINLEFPTQSEFEGGTQEFLYRLRKSELKDDALLEEFYDKVIQSYDYAENYLILLIHNVYDIPGITSDGLGLEDASEDVFSFIQCSICPVNLSKPGLSYYSENKAFQNCSRNWLVGMPEIGFLFPAFNERSADLHATLYYSKNAASLHHEFIDAVLGTAPPTPADAQKELFQALVEETLGERREYETLMNIHESIQERIDENKDNGEPLTLDKKEVKEVFSRSGLEPDQMERFEAAYEQIIPQETSIVAENIVNARKFEVTTPNVTVQVKPDFVHLLETKVVDGRNCLVIAIEDQVEVNGIPLTNR